MADFHDFHSVPISQRDTANAIQVRQIDLVIHRMNRKATASISIHSIPKSKLFLRLQFKFFDFLN